LGRCDPYGGGTRELIYPGQVRVNGECLAWESAMSGELRRLQWIAILAAVRQAPVPESDGDMAELAKEFVNFEPRQTVVLTVGTTKLTDHPSRE